MAAENTKTIEAAEFMKHPVKIVRPLRIQERYFPMKRCIHSALFFLLSIWLGISMARAEKTGPYTLAPSHAADFERVGHTVLPHAPSYLNPQFFALRQDNMPIGYIYSVDPEPGEEAYRTGELSDCQITWLDAKTGKRKTIKTLIRMRYNGATDCNRLSAIGIVYQNKNIIKIGFIYNVSLFATTVENPSGEDEEPVVMTLDPRTGTWAFDEKDANKVFMLHDVTLSGMHKIFAK
ncbi:hypothetical protein [Komagataeibacter melaceti]|uniref:hypothetical protein n=1 Tax=Komagataeibacter melaceti TaxID=2766577 RepID=UPI0011E5FBB1|nr:hypothetical protein [Komagataeibacter melaceti]